MYIFLTTIPGCVIFNRKLHTHKPTGTILMILCNILCWRMLFIVEYSAYRYYFIASEIYQARN